MFDVLVLVGDNVKNCYHKEKQWQAEFKAHRLAKELEKEDKPWSVRILTGTTLIWEDGSRTRMLKK